MKKSVGLVMALALLLLAGCDFLATEPTLPAATETSFPSPTPEVLEEETEAGRIQIGLAPQSVTAGEGTVSLHITFPEGWHINTEAPPFQAVWKVDGQLVQIDDADQSISQEDPTFPLEAPATLAEGETEAAVDVDVYYCDETKTICTLDLLTLVMPVTVSPIATSNTLVFAYEIVPPAME